MADLTTLSDVAFWLEEQDGQGALISDTDGTLIGELIAAVSRGIERWCGRDFLRATYNETHDGRGGTQLTTRNRPIRSVARVTIGATDVPFGSAVVAGWYFDPRRILLTGYRFTVGAANISVIYDAGFDTVPADVHLAATQLAGTWYRERSHTGLSSQTLQQQVTSFLNQDMPPNVMRVLESYRRVVPV